MSKALEGVRVLDFSRVLAGPYCSMILADLGAEVIKVEREGGGDDLRHWGPPFMPDGESTYFLSVNRNKRSITLDLKNPAGLEVARQLAAESDVVLENFRAGVMGALGLDYAELSKLNPALVYCAINGYGTTGPMAHLPGYDVVAQGISGLMSITGEQDGSPMRVGVAVADIVTGLYATIAILGALQSRSRTGRGQQVDLSLLESCLAIMPNLTAGFLMGGSKPKRLGNGHPNTVPYRIFDTRDGKMTLAIGNDAQWRRLCAAAGGPAMATDPRYAANHERVKRREEVEAMVSGWLKARPTQEWVDLLADAEVPCGPIFTVDRILEDAQVEALQLVKTMAHPTSGTLRMVGAPFHLSEDDTHPYLPPPLLGEHTEQVLGERLRATSVDVKRLAAKGAFGPKAKAAAEAAVALAG